MEGKFSFDKLPSDLRSQILKILAPQYPFDELTLEVMGQCTRFVADVKTLTIMAKEMGVLNFGRTNFSACDQTLSIPTLFTDRNGCKFLQRRRSLDIFLNSCYISTWMVRVLKCF